MNFNNILRKFLQILAILSISFSIIIFIFVIINSIIFYSFDPSYKGFVCLISFFEPFKMIFTNTIIAIAAYLASHQNYLTNQSNRNDAYLNWSDKLDVILQPKSDQLKSKIAVQSKEIYEFLLKLDFKATKISLKDFINTFLSNDDINTIIKYQVVTNFLNTQTSEFFNEFWSLICDLMSTGKSNTELREWFYKYLEKKIETKKQV